MATQKPISTISYNSEAFLREKLEALYKAHIVQAYMYICHKGEDGDKDHIHVFIIPNKRIDPMDLADEFKEFDHKHPTKPLCCRPFRPSKEEDWILYAVHDSQYLRTKYSNNEKGEKIPYKYEDIHTSELFDVETCFIRAKSHLERTSANMADRLQNGVNPITLIKEGNNPYIVNSIVTALGHSDYTRVSNELAQITIKYNALQEFLLQSGFVISYDDDGFPSRIERCSDAK